MFDCRLRTYCNVMLVSVAALSVAACGGSGSYRVASVGSVPAGDDGTAGVSSVDDGGGATGDGSSGDSGTGGSTGTGSGGTTGANKNVVGRVLVTAGNTVIGVLGKHDALAGKITGLAPGTTIITGTVTTVLRKTGQSLVDLGQGQSLILTSARGKLGEVVGIDLLSRTVTSASSGSHLLGVSVLSPTVATGRLAAVNVGNGGPLLTVGNGQAGALTPVTNVVNGVLGGVTGRNASPTPGGTAAAPLTGKVGDLLGGLTGKPH